MVAETATPHSRYDLKVLHLFNEAKASAQRHTKISQNLWGLQEDNPEKFMELVCLCLRHILLISQVRSNLEGSVRRRYKSFETLATVCLHLHLICRKCYRLERNGM